MTASSTLEGWLERIGTEHPGNVERGLDRVRQVAHRLGVNPPAPTNIVVAGTNGKGSTVAMLEQVLGGNPLAGGERVGTTTSPHLYRFNERIRCGGSEASDDEIVAAFEAIEAARGDVRLSYFEFAILAAFCVHRRRGATVGVLEVGLGGRLDAVNIVDADVAVITGIGFDHEEYLGHTLEAIGAEKAGIMRPGVPVVVGEAEPPASIPNRARELAAPLYLAGRQFGYIEGGFAEGGYYATTADGERLSYPGPCPGQEACAIAPANAAIALQAAVLLQAPTPAAWRSALSRVRNPGRFEIIHAHDRTFVLDVAHNGHGARFLADEMRRRFGRARCVLLGCLADKDIVAIVEPLRDCTDAFLYVDTEGSRGRAAVDMRHCASGGALDKRHSASGGADGDAAFAGPLDEALENALSLSKRGDVIAVAGSFDIVGRARQWLLE